MYSTKWLPWIGLAVSSIALAPAVRAADAAAAGKSDNDVQIVQRVLAMNEAEERTSAAVRGKISSPGVWQLAERMHVDHGTLGRKFREVSDASSPAKTGTEPANVADASLSALSGADLEKAYIDREVKSHEVMLTALYVELSNATGPELQRGLLDARTAVAAHLDEARVFQRQLWVLDTIKQERAAISREISQ
jgi:putative membrane protein